MDESRNDPPHDPTDSSWRDLLAEEPAPWDGAEPLGDVLNVQCPYCFEEVEIFVERDVEGSLVQDCEVCCHPWQLTLERFPGKEPRLRVDLI